MKHFCYTYMCYVQSVMNHSLTHSWSWDLLEKLPIVQLLKNFPAFYGTRRFITVFTRALYWSISWARSIQSIPSHPISLRSILILSTHLRLGLPSGLFHSGFPTNILYAFRFSPIRATCPVHHSFAFPPRINCRIWLLDIESVIGYQIMKL
jgi:hypothetical protein